MWRSLVAHLTGGQGAAGSNPVIPTYNRRSGPVRRFAGGTGPGLCRQRCRQPEHAELRQIRSCRTNCLPAERGLQAGGGVPLLPGADVRVDIGGNRERRVAKQFLHYSHRGPGH